MNGRIEVSVKSDGCAGGYGSDVRRVEHVQAVVSLTSSRRGHVQLYLTSPGGTRSTLLAGRRGNNHVMIIIIIVIIIIIERQAFCSNAFQYWYSVSMLSYYVTVCRPSTPRTDCRTHFTHLVLIFKLPREYIYRGLK